MKKLLPAIIVTMIVLVSSTFHVAYCPGVGPGTLEYVYYSSGGVVPHDDPGNDGRFWIVVPGNSYRVHLTNIELDDGTTTVWIKGKTTSGTPWTIELTDQIVSAGEITSDIFDVPSNAGCTIVVAYEHKGHLAQDVIQPGTPGHMKTYYDDETRAVPCEAPGVPEFPFVSGIVTSLGLIGALLLRRRQKKPRELRTLHVT